MATDRDRTPQLGRVGEGSLHTPSRARARVGKPAHPPQPSPERTFARTLAAYVTATAISTRVWCAWCRRWHSHGHVDASAPLGHGDGHRQAHCIDAGSPYDSTGYHVREIGWWDDRPDWQELPVICRPCGDAFYRDHPAERYCSDTCRRQGRTAA